MHGDVQPVLDPAAVAAVDGYEVPQRLRAAVRVQQIADVFPFGICLARAWIWTTPNGMCRWITEGRQARPGAATSARSHAPGTGRPPTAAGPNTNPNLATSAPLTAWIRLPRHQPRHPRPRSHHIQQRRLERVQAQTGSHPRVAGPRPCALVCSEAVASFRTRRAGHRKPSDSCP